MITFYDFQRYSLIVENLVGAGQAAILNKIRFTCSIKLELYNWLKINRCCVRVLDLFFVVYPAAIKYLIQK